MKKIISFGHSRKEMTPGQRGKARGQIPLAEVPAQGGKAGEDSSPSSRYDMYLTKKFK
jgi:hypothetical protein